MRRFGIFVAMAGLFLLLTATAVAQTAVEYSTATAAGTTGAAAGGKGVSKSIGGILGNVGKVLDKAKNPESTRETAGPTQVITPSATARGSSDAARETSAPPAETIPRKLVRPEFIEMGMARAELVKRCGTPFMKTSRVDGSDFVETYYYNAEEDIVVVTVREGKVTDISPPAVTAESRRSASR